MRTRIKICGITQTESAQAAIQCGADAIGLMFYPPSPRHLALPQAQQIRRSLTPFIGVVAVLVDPQADYVRQIVHQVAPHYLQFHGDEPPEFCGQFGLPYIKSVRVGTQSAQQLCQLERRYADACGILLDTHVSGRYGGTGQTFDWPRAAYGGHKACILAGGLQSHNVALAIQTARPYAVDVSSGVESNGHKDAAKIAEFCQKVRVSG